MTIPCQKIRSPNAIDASVGKNLRTLRLLRRWSQEKLAADIGITFQALQRYENGKIRIGASRIVALADALGCHPADLFINVSDGTPGEIWNKFDSLGEVRFLKTFQLIACPKQKAKVLALIETLAGVDD